MTNSERGGGDFSNASYEQEPDTKKTKQKRSGPVKRVIKKVTFITGTALGALHAVPEASAQKINIRGAIEGAIQRGSQTVAENKRAKADVQMDSDQEFVRRVTRLGEAMRSGFTDLTNKYEHALTQYEFRYANDKTATLSEGDLSMLDESVEEARDNYTNLIILIGKNAPVGREGNLHPDNTETFGKWGSVVFPGLSSAGYGSQDARLAMERSDRLARSEASDEGISVLQDGRSMISRLETITNDNNSLTTDTKTRTTFRDYLKFMKAMQREASKYLGSELANTTPTLQRPGENDAMHKFTTDKYKPPKGR